MKTSEKTAPLSWEKFWDDKEFWTYPEIFEVNAKILKDKLEEVYPLTKQEKILNIGCGPGFFEKLIAEDVEKIVSTDVSPNFLKRCKENVAAFSNVEIFSLKEKYTDLSFLYDQKFSLILCVSVIQYYKSLEEVAELIISAQKYALPGAKMWLLDIPVKGNAFESFCSKVGILRKSIRAGYLGLLLSKIIRGLPQILEYRLYSSKIKHLNKTALEYQEYIEGLGFKTEILEQDFSICTNRLNMIVHF